MRDRLDLTEDVCFATDDPLNAFVATLSDYAYLVTFEGSTLNSEMDQNPLLIIENSFYGVTFMNRLHSMDESGLTQSLIERNSTNLFEMKRKALRALVGWRLEIDGEDDLEITSTTKATRCSKPELYVPREGGNYVAMMSLTFNVSYVINACEEWGNWYA